MLSRSEVQMCLMLFAIYSHGTKSTSTTNWEDRLQKKRVSFNKRWSIVREQRLPPHPGKNVSYREKSQTGCCIRASSSLLLSAALQAPSHVASQVEHNCIGDLHGLIFNQHDVVSVQVGLLPLLHLQHKTKAKHIFRVTQDSVLNESKPSFLNTKLVAHIKTAYFRVTDIENRLQKIVRFHDENIAQNKNWIKILSLIVIIPILFNRNRSGSSMALQWYFICFISTHISL